MLLNKKMVHDFLSSEGLGERLVDGCEEQDLPYRRITGKDKNAYVWMEAKKYIDANENTAIITLHNEKIVQNTVIKMERELNKKRTRYDKAVLGYGITFNYCIES